MSGTFAKIAGKCLDCGTICLQIERIFFIYLWAKMAPLMVNGKVCRNKGNDSFIAIVNLHY